MKPYERYLTARDMEILDFVHRYRLGTEGMLAEQVFTVGNSKRNIRRVLGRLERRLLLRRERWDKGYWYYTPTPRSCRLLGLPPQTPEPLTEQSLPTVLAVAYYCVGHGEQRMTAKEFAELYPSLWQPGMRSSSYVLVDTPDGLKLELLLVDRGGAARRIRSRVRRVIKQRSRLPDFVTLMEVERFRVNVLTGSDEQRDRIHRQLQKESFAPVEVVSTVVPELAEILLLRK